MHDAEIALLDQVEEGDPRRLVLLGDRNNQAEVGLHESAFGLIALAGPAPQAPFDRRGGRLDGVELFAGLVAGLDGLGQADLVLLGEEGVLADIGEIQPYEIFLVALDALFGQGQLPDPARAHSRGDTLSTVCD